ncbi:hypothetical protein BDP27DRAFT_1374033 [Rhodocollybia butyracea]|uniref:Uncharacterized protein n=1 Tax=Rhodocollybia butyracea TaxID=206335 RepID=A0A9P5P759_9AGAR|nr:hypothetical protein BDP27DRAFT_1374033 [Rhodocollybia butyracea]
MAHFIFGLGLIAVTFIETNTPLEPNTDKATEVPATGAGITPLEPNTDKATEVVAGFNPAPHTSQTTPPSPQITTSLPVPQTTAPPALQTTSPSTLQTTSPSALQTSTSPSAIQTTSSSTPPVVSKQSQELAKAIGGGVGGLFLILLATQRKIASTEEFTRSCIHFLFKLSLQYCKSTAYNRRHNAPCVKKWQNLSLNIECSPVALQDTAGDH